MAGETKMQMSLPLDKLKAETLKLIYHNLGVPLGTKFEMIRTLCDVAVQSAAMEGECCLQLVVTSLLMVRKHLY